MLKKRIIPCFDIKDGRVVKGVNFVGLRDAGNPVELAAQYALAGADELVFLDITATQENRKTLTDLVAQIAAEINIPFTVGGGINSVADAEKIIRSGADKISLNSSAVKNQKLITDIAKSLGTQAVVVAIDTKLIDGKWQVFISGGKVATGLDTVQWAQQAEQLGAGELLLTSMNNDGTKAGFALDILNLICDAVSIPVIASGGAGNMAHFKEVFTQTHATAALAASIFHYGEIGIQQLKDYLKTENIAIR
ncbi:imidazole glycerol phosphate synthase subunit HisF [Flavobacterium subsaxonicum]|uniref:Imidazole glycerol phosphate synthase subunit HisF n=1 Tax=Flavobacterium subsaxonicum WB 4.1-42 = DSM 21790 TaxID=1121898 RepID=A0A0A2MHE8_9FLAO|nr:imidazole glycerol phosphate synthase subunit HisF [Flavobacterium subsaxonicum]KGO91684.1 imidazole glycerol phosphate synthase [Flavobacterium subsaxonicum WB 4.1-42 = DSM 21790]